MILCLFCPIWVPGEGIYFIIRVFWCMAYFIDAIHYVEHFPLFWVQRQHYALRQQLVSLSQKAIFFLIFSHAQSIKIYLTLICHSILYKIPPVKMVISALFYQFPPVKLIQNDPYEFLIVLMWCLIKTPFRTFSAL